MIRAAIEKVLTEYDSARKQAFSGHPLAEFLRRQFPDYMKEIADNPERYRFKGSAGQASWARCPWVAVFDILVTETAQSGYYPVFLFREDMRGVYLSLNQGVTDIRKKYRENPKKVLRLRALDFRARIGSPPADFEASEIDLAVTSASGLAAFYEDGHILGSYYGLLNLPSEDRLVADFRKMLKLYETLAYQDNIPITLSDREEDEGMGSPGVEDLTKLRLHKRIDRNRRLSRNAKAVHGYRCQACNFNFEESYGQLGKGFIEAHHLQPISSLKGQRVERDPVRDFAVLCSNCHSMIHKFDSPEDVAAFRDILVD